MWQQTQSSAVCRPVLRGRRLALGHQTAGTRNHPTPERGRRVLMSPRTRTPSGHLCRDSTVHLGQKDRLNLRPLFSPPTSAETSLNICYIWSRACPPSTHTVGHVGPGRDSSLIPLPRVLHSVWSLLDKTLELLFLEARSLQVHLGGSLAPPMTVWPSPP